MGTPKTQKTPECLRYENHGRFVLGKVSTTLRRKLKRDPYWKEIRNDAFATTHVGAAAVFRNKGDERTKRLFDRRFQEFYGTQEVPPCVVDALDPHQCAGLDWVLSRKRSYLAHAPGAGKTAVAVMAACLTQGEGPSLFIVPPSLVTNWEREILKFTDWLGEWPAIGVVQSSPKRWETPWRATYLICPDSMLAKDWVQSGILTRAWRTVIVDEASRFKEATAKRSVAFYGGVTVTPRAERDKGAALRTRYPGIYRGARHVIFLDGSPMPNRAMELWAPTFALDPEAIDCMSQDDFGYRYCGAKPNDRGVWEFLHSSNEAELKGKLQKSFMHVVTEDELSHPERRRSMMFVSDVRSPEQKTWERKHLTRALEGDLDKGEIAHYRRELGIRKIPLAARYIADRLTDKDESILIFAWHREVCLGLQEALKKWHPMVVMGGVSQTDRDHAMALFQGRQIRPLILNITAGGRGNNLQRADRVVFVEWSWNDEENKQCEKRASRRGSEKRFIRSDYLVVENSMDERTLSSVFTKERRVKKVIG